MSLPYQRILLKLSGEALLGDKEFGIDYEVLHQVCEEIKAVKELGVEIVVVIGAGNIWRGGQNAAASAGADGDAAEVARQADADFFDVVALAVGIGGHAY